MLNNTFFKPKNQSPYQKAIRLSSLEKPKQAKIAKLQLSNKINKFELEAIILSAASGMQSKQRSNSKRFKTEQGVDYDDNFINNYSSQHQKTRSQSNAFFLNKSSDRHKQPRQKSVVIPKELTEEEQILFGNRFPAEFTKIKLLGRGGFSLVWLGEHKVSKARVAIKQIRSSNSHQSHLKEIWFGSHFFDEGKPKPEFKNHTGMKNLVQFFGYDLRTEDTWIFTEVCGESLGAHLYDLKGEQKQSEIVYKMIQKPLYQYLLHDQNQLKKIIKDIAQALILLSEERIVHCDIKTENILIKANKCLNGQYMITQTKLIDYGSSFPFDDLSQFSMATPEYMCPEILNYILCENKSNYDKKMMKYLQNYNKPWVIDIWSLGCVILEIVYGIPLWMSYKTLVTKQNKQYYCFGLFAVKNRVFEKIIEKQIEVANNLDYYLDNNFSGIKVDLELRLLLKEMLVIDPDKRIAPHTIIEFLKPLKERLKTQ